MPGRALLGLLLVLAALALPGGCAAPPSAAVASGRLVLAQLCDPQLGFVDYSGELERFRRQLRQIAAGDYDAVVICGDLVHRPTPEAYADLRRELAVLNIPVYLLPGNHDIGPQETDRAAEFFRREIGPDRFAADLPGGFRLVALNTQLWQNPPSPAAEAQDRMLQTELERAARNGRPVIVAGHVPLFVDVPDEPDAYFNLPAARRRELLERFATAPVAAYLAGHTHTAFSAYWRGVLFSNGETTSVVFDHREFGFRRLEFADGRIRVTTIPLK